MTTAELTPDPSGVIEIPVSDARDRLADVIELVREDDQFVYLTRRGKRVAAIMPADIAENYERIEDDYWARQGDEAQERIRSGESGLVSLDEVIAKAEGRR